MEERGSSTQGGEENLGGAGSGLDSGIDGGVGACPPAEFKEAALRAYGVEWAYAKLLAVEFCESTCNPETLGRAMERGVLQFHPDTWAGEWNPYRFENAHNPIVAWHAAGAFIKAGRYLEWSCWWLTP